MFLLGTTIKITIGGVSYVKKPLHNFSKSHGNALKVKIQSTLGGWVGGWRAMFSITVNDSKVLTGDLNLRVIMT